MKTPEVQQIQIGEKRETTKFGPRMIFEQPDGIVFVAEYILNNPKDKILNCYWPCGKSLEDFKKTVGNNDREVVWEEKQGIQWGIARGRFFWFDPMYKGRTFRAGVQINVTGFSDINSFLKKIKNIASATIIEKAKLPQNLTGKLKRFVATT